MNLSPRKALRDVVPVNEFVAAIRLSRVERTPGQRALLDTLTDSDIDSLQDKAKSVIAYKRIVELLLFGSMVFSSLLLGVALTFLPDNALLYLLPVAGPMLLLSALLMIWAALKFGDAPIANRVLRPVGPERDVAEALKLTQNVPFCEAYRQEVLSRRSVLRVFDVALILDMGKSQRNSYEFYIDELRALNKKA